MQQNVAIFVFFYISQGRAATYLRRGRQCGTDFAAYFSQNTTVKVFWKSADICQSYEQMYSGPVFDWLCIVFLPLITGYSSAKILK